MDALVEINGNLLREPEPTADLEQLARELNELAHVRQNARVAFCRRLAAAYLLIVGHRPSNGSSDGKKFRAWCDAKIRSANKKRYSHRTLELYLIIGFAKNPEAIVRQRTDDANSRAREVRRFGAAVINAIEKEARVLPIIQIKKKFETTGDVAREINALMTAWEQACPQSRNHFLYLVTGRRVA
jgi:hypothetical protein